MSNIVNLGPSESIQEGIDRSERWRKSLKPKNFLEKLKWKIRPPKVTLFIPDGDYKENIELPKNVEIRGTS